MESWTFFMKTYYLRIGQGERSKARRLCARTGNPGLRIMGGFDSAPKIYLSMKPSKRFFINGSSIGHPAKKDSKGGRSEGAGLISSISGRERLSASSPIP